MARRGAKPIFLKTAAVLAAGLLAASCVGPSAREPAAPLAERPAPAAPAASAVDAIGAGVRPGPAVTALPLTPAGSDKALAAFRSSCRALLKRQDASGLTRATDWQPACAAAADWPRADAPAFFARFFETAQVGEGQLFATGYYEPEIAGSRVPALGYDTPVYANPGDLVEADLGQWAPDLAGRKIRGRVEKNRLVPYYDRGAIEDGALKGRNLEIAYAADPIELFFLQIQGSGRLRLPDGGVMRLGYDGQNGREYLAIGRTMRERGLLAPGQATMQGIMAWLRAHPAEGRALMRENRSYIFFRELTGEGPLGALGVPVAGRVSLAADPKFTPLGAPVWLGADRPEATGLWVAQDIGGAIKGPNRFDTFWGAGDEARTIAGGMAARGLAYLLLPVGTLERIGSLGGRGGTTARP